jgi:hypothetical protein
MFNIETPMHPVVIFRRDVGNCTFYSISVNKKDASGNLIYGALPCRFKKSIEIKNEQKIWIKKAFIDWYKKGYETKPVLFITEFANPSEHKEEERINNALEDFENELKSESFDEEDFGF